MVTQTKLQSSNAMVFPVSRLASRVFRTGLPADFRSALSENVPECPTSLKEAIKNTEVSTAAQLVDFCRMRPDACNNMGDARAFLLLCRVAASDNGKQHARHMLENPAIARVFLKVVKQAIAPRLISRMLERNIRRVQGIAQSKKRMPSLTPDIE